MHTDMCMNICTDMHVETCVLRSIVLLCMYVCIHGIGLHAQMYWYGMYVWQGLCRYIEASSAAGCVVVGYDARAAPLDQNLAKHFCLHNL